MALRWADVDLATGVIRVERSWDDKAQVFVEPKSRAGRRRVPIPAVLRDVLVKHKMSARGELVLPRANGRLPFDATAAAARSRGLGAVSDSTRSRCTKRATLSRA
jgi:integrase